MNDRIRDLMEKRKKAIEDARALKEKADSEKRLLTDDENRTYDKLWDEQQKYKKQIQQEEREVELQREDAESELRRKDFDKDKTKGKPVDPDELAMRGFRSYLRYGNQFTGEGAQEFRALQADSDQAGGYTVPQQFVASLIKAVDDAVFVRGLATVIPVTTGDSLGAPSLDADVEDGTWSGEITAFDEDTQMDFGKRELKPHPLKKLIKVSDKLLRVSALPIDQIVRQRLAYKFGLTQEKAYLTGTGASQPLGVFTASSNGISTGRDVSTDNTTSAFTADGLKNAKYSLKAPYRSKSQWIMHRDAVKMASKLKDGEGRYLWQDAIRENEPDMLLGRPVNESEHAPSTFTTGLYVGLIGDFSYYWIADSLAIRIEVAKELYKATSQVGYFADYDGDGMPVLEEAFARVKLA